MPRPRRKRYVVTIGGKDLHCLAYSVAWIQEQYPQATAVRPWSAVRSEQAAQAGTWGIDHDALAEAKDFFGLRLPLNIILLDGASTTRGGYALIPTGEAYVQGTKVYNLDTATAAGTQWHHRIRLRKGMTAAQASQTLWHELTHAMQAERSVYDRITAGYSPRRVFNAWKHAGEYGRTAYADKAVEREARAHEAYAGALPLVKSVATRTVRR